MELLCRSLNGVARRNALKKDGNADRMLQESLPGVLYRGEFSRV